MELPASPLELLCIPSPHNFSNKENGTKSARKGFTCPVCAGCTMSTRRKEVTSGKESLELEQRGAAMESRRKLVFEIPVLTAENVGENLRDFDRIIGGPMNVEGGTIWNRAIAAAAIEEES